ncbi:MAG: rod shape-determining protein MreC [Candidatus Azotimanducaceae bacterium]|jgi:rod shape-determining protein MreC
MVGLCILSICLMSVDHLSNYLDDVRATLSAVITPIIFLSDYPNKTVEVFQDTIISRGELMGKVEMLEQKLLLLNAKTEKMAALSAENKRLRDLLGSAAKLQDNVLVAELVGLNPDPNRHEVIIDKGSRHEVFVGQPVLDANGLLGQVIEVSLLVSRVLLISDQTHGIPVQVVRSNLRLIAQGTGASRELELMHVQETADIKVGDLLVSSGLGDRFPVGYPVGRVKQVEFEPGQPFAKAIAEPTALLDRSRHVLLVFTEAKLNGSLQTSVKQALKDG